MLNSAICFGILLFKCLGTFSHNQNCHAFVYPDRNAYDTGTNVGKRYMTTDGIFEKETVLHRIHFKGLVIFRLGKTGLLI